jgi:hypothetical protein
MSTSLLILTPLALLAIVLFLCFVGCVFPHGSALSDFTRYSDETILPTVGLMAIGRSGSRQGQPPQSTSTAGTTAPI